MQTRLGEIEQEFLLTAKWMDSNNPKREFARLIRLPILDYYSEVLNQKFVDEKLKSKKKI